MSNNYNKSKKATEESFANAQCVISLISMQSLFLIEL